MSVSSYKLEQPQPLLERADLEPPLATEELVDAAHILTHAGIEPDDTAQEAVGFYRRKEMLRLMGNATFNASLLPERLEKLEADLPVIVNESTFMTKLLHDFVQARDTDSSEAKSDLFGIKARKLERQRIAALKEKAAIHETITLADFAEGDKVVFTSSVETRTKAKAKAILSGEVIGDIETKEGAALLVKVTRHKLSINSKCKRPSPERSKGSVVRILGTGHHEMLNTTHTQIFQRGILKFISTSGCTSSDNVIDDKETDWLRGTACLRLDQVALNGTDIFPKPQK